MIGMINELIGSKQHFDEYTEAGHFHKVSLTLVGLGDLLREQIQADTSSQIRIIIQKLNSNSDINNDDLMFIRLWLIGDAQAYLEMENDYKGWLTELNRLLSVVEDVKAEPLDTKTMYELSGTVRDAIRVIGDIVFFKQQQERVQKFEEAAKNLHSKNKQVLAKILSEKLQSEKM